jgi:uncharacterized radical SAM protein YgiQ
MGGIAHQSGSDLTKETQIEKNMFLPVTRKEMSDLGWDQCDVIIVTGDSYIDSPFIGAAQVGKWLYSHGFRVGVIAQPDINSAGDITRLGEPALFWGVSGGSVDSMVANYTALKKRRKSDDFTPGGINNRRPDRAVIAYSNLIRRWFKATRPIVLGGIEASLRRVAHYDYWSDGIRRSILFDSKANVLIYGMGERAVLELAQALRDGSDFRTIRGLCYISAEPQPGYVNLASYETVAMDEDAFIGMFRLFYENNDPVTARGLNQQHGSRWLVQNPPAKHLSVEELDQAYDLSFEREQHPYHQQFGSVRALDTIRFSISTHRGCYGECNFCAIAAHQGRTVVSRSLASILKEAEELARHPGFRGIISDVGGPTANMYGFECDRKDAKGSCQNKRCIGAQVCAGLKPSHRRQIELLKKLRQIAGVKKVFVASGLRYDLILQDQAHGEAYLQELVTHHVSGQLKVAPEHTVPHVLELMNKPAVELLTEFKRRFDRLSADQGKQQFLTYYLIAAYPGCTDHDMQQMQHFVSRELQITPEQVQIFTPAPSTWASVMYYTRKNPFTGERLFVEKNRPAKEQQKQRIVRPLTRFAARISNKPKRLTDKKS